jgi:hypothetical protein
MLLYFIILLLKFQLEKEFHFRKFVSATKFLCVYKLKKSKIQINVQNEKSIFEDIKSSILFKPNTSELQNNLDDFLNSMQSSSSPKTPETSPKKGHSHFPLLNAKSTPAKKRSK